MTIGTVRRVVRTRYIAPEQAVQGKTVRFSSFWKSALSTCLSRRLALTHAAGTRAPTKSTRAVSMVGPASQTKDCCCASVSFCSRRRHNSPQALRRRASRVLFRRLSLRPWRSDGQVGGGAPTLLPQPTAVQLSQMSSLPAAFLPQRPKQRMASFRGHYAYKRTSLEEPFREAGYQSGRERVYANDDLKLKSSAIVPRK